MWWGGVVGGLRIPGAKNTERPDMNRKRQNGREREREIGRPHQTDPRVWARPVREG